MRVLFVTKYYLWRRCYQLGRISDSKLLVKLICVNFCLGSSAIDYCFLFLLKISFKRFSLTYSYKYSILKLFNEDSEGFSFISERSEYHRKRCLLPLRQLFLLFFKSTSIAEIVFSLLNIENTGRPLIEQLWINEHSKTLLNHLFRGRDTVLWFLE